MASYCGVDFGPSLCIRLEIAACWEMIQKQKSQPCPRVGRWMAGCGNDWLIFIHSLQKSGVREVLFSHPPSACRTTMFLGISRQPNTDSGVQVSQSFSWLRNKNLHSSFAFLHHWKPSLCSSSVLTSGAWFLGRVSTCREVVALRRRLMCETPRSGCNSGVCVSLVMIRVVCRACSCPIDCARLSPLGFQNTL